MADKNINFNIKVNNKELDLTKTSFKEFNETIKQAKANLSSMPLTDPRYKQLATDINAAEKAWKSAQKSSSEFNDEQESGAKSIKTYAAEIKLATKELMAIEQQFGINSAEYQKQAQVVADLREAQEDLNRQTQQLDDSLARIPGPIGDAVNSFKMFEDTGKNLSAAFGKMGISFKTFDGILKASGIGAIVLIIATLVAAVMDAAKSFEPLQEAFAKIKDAVGALFDALKPVTDFILKVFVKVIEVAANVLNGIASAFGGVNTSVNQTTLTLEREIRKQERIISDLGNTVSENVKKQLDVWTDYQKKLLEITKQEEEALEKATSSGLFNIRESRKAREKVEKEYDGKRKLAEQLYQLDIQNIRNEYAENYIKDREKIESETDKIRIKSIDNDRVAQSELLKNSQKYNQGILNAEDEFNKSRVINLRRTLFNISKLEFENKDEVVKNLVETLRELETIQKNAYKLNKINVENSIEEEKKLKRQAYREDVAAINERALSIQEISTSLIKDENQRNLQAAKDNLNVIKEQQRLELEQARLSGISLKNLKDKQRAEMVAANEQVRLAQIEFDASMIQLEINKQTRLAEQGGYGSQQYFDAMTQIATMEYEKAVKLADGNADKIEEARHKLWKDMADIDRAGLDVLLAISQTQFDSLYEGTSQYYDKQRELTQQEYQLRQQEAKGNYDMLEALALQHSKDMAMIDAAELRSKAEIEAKKASTVSQISDEYFAYTREQEMLNYEASLIAAGDNAAMIEAINMDHAQKMRDIDYQQYEAKKQLQLAIIDVTAQFGATLNQIGMDMMEAAQGRDEQQFKNAKKMAIAGVGIEKAATVLSIIANTAVANAKSIAAFPLTAGMPWVAINTVAAGLSIASTIAGAIKAISQINGQSFEAGAGQAKGNNLGRGYATGGVITGPGSSTSDSIPVRLSDGESVINANSTSMFGPLLSAMNEAGGGVPFGPNMTMASPDKPIVRTPSTDNSMIVKTYVVETEITSAQQRQARLKDLSTL